MQKAYERAGDHSKATINLNQYILLKDSLFNAEKHFQLVDLQTQYETEKKQQQIELQNITLQKNTAELSKKNLFIIFLGSGLLLLFALSFAIYNLYRTKKHDNDLLKAQKMVIEVKNKQITDSINYARRIQNAILPSENELQKAFTESFILFKPKDIVSGDFFYIREVNSSVLVAAADCTGHGVPGAFMSVLGITLLNEIVATGNTSTASAVLETLREKAKEALHQSSYKSETKDGMEMALCLFNKNGSTLQYAGAGCPLYHIRNSELTNYKATRNPIGVYLKEQPFENNHIPTQKGDTLYIFSDGYADQIGGKNGDKLKITGFKKLLTENAHLPMSQQKEILDKFIVDYTQGYEQIDDILIIGIRI